MQAALCRSITVGTLTTILLLQMISGIATHPQELSVTSEVHSTSSSLDYLEIIGPNSTVHADASVPLDLRWHDRNGTNVSVLLPLDNWSAENGNFRINGDFVEWLPSQVGTWRISAHAEGVETWLDLTVITGAISHVWIDAEHDILTADEETPLILQAEDSRGNSWPISAEWAVQEPEVAASLVSNIDGVKFVGGLAGIWNVTASHSSSNGTFITYLPIEVHPGRLARILLAGDGTTVSSDESVDLNPELSDADGNLIEGIQLNWTVDGEDMTPQFQLSGGVWQPTTTGDYLIEADAAGRSARSRIYVNQGEPQRIEIDIDLINASVTNSGDVFQISTFAEDLDGNQDPWSVEWNLPHNSLQIEETTEVGVYDARGLGQGIWDIEVQNGTAIGNFTLQVLIGEPRSLRIGQHGGVGEQGKMYSLEVTLVDFGGNPVSIQTSQFSFETEIGTVRHDVGPFWFLELENPGDEQVVTVSYEEWTAVTYIDVEPTGLDRLTGSQGGQMLLGGFILVVLLIGLLMYIVRRNAVVESHWDDEYDIFEPTVTPSTESSTKISQQQVKTSISRHSRGKLSPQLQQDRIPSMDDQTGALVEHTEPIAIDPVFESSGVLQAMEGTIQGQTGWYQTAQGESQYWQVDAAGQWSQVK